MRLLVLAASVFATGITFAVYAAGPINPDNTGGAQLPLMAFQLISPEEGSLPSAGVMQVSTRGLRLGPTIEQVSPLPDAAVPSGNSINLDIRFGPRNGSAIDPKTVRVTYLRQPEVDLTPRLKPYISDKGIEAHNVVLPAGVHLIRVEVADSRGASTTQIVKIMIAAK